MKLTHEVDCVSQLWRPGFSLLGNLRLWCSQAYSSKWSLWAMRCHKLCVDKIICILPSIFYHICCHRQSQDMYLHGRLNRERGMSSREQEKLRSWDGTRPSQNRVLLEIMVSAFSLYLRLTKNEKAPFSAFISSITGRETDRNSSVRKVGDLESQCSE